MALSGVSVGAVALMGGGVLFVWSGLHGAHVTGSLRDLLAGKQPQPSPDLAIGGLPTVGTSGGGSPGGGGAAPADASETAWITAILAGVGALPTQANIRSMTAWIAKETPWPPVAKNNPMNTTLNAPGATNYNSAGVKNYPTAAEGVAATVSTLNGYPGIVQSLRSGTGLCGGGLANEFSKWSGGGYVSVC